MGAVKQWMLGQHSLLETPNCPMKPRLPIPRETIQAVNDRCIGACEGCWTDGLLDLHHLNYNTQGEERPEDLLVLCRSCHENMHQDSLGVSWDDPVAMRHQWGADPNP